MTDRSNVWTMNPGESVVLSADLSADMEDGVTISSPVVTVYTVSAGVYTDVTSSLSFTVSGEQINASAITDEDGDTISEIGDAVVFQLTATTTLGTYKVVVKATGSDGTTPKTERTLKVQGGQ